MPKMHVLVSDEGAVLGTFRENGPGVGTAPPSTIGFRPGEGQKVLELDVDDQTASLEPDALHAAIKANHLS
jgi:hypothetical protein